jgi:hypothetical protein
MSIVPPSTGFLAKSSLMAFSSSKNVPLVASPSHNKTAKPQTSMLNKLQLIAIASSKLKN